MRKLLLIVLLIQSYCLFGQGKAVDMQLFSKVYTECDSLNKLYLSLPGEDKFPALLTIISIIKDFDIDTAMSYANKGLREAERINSKYYIGKFMLQKGELERINGNYDNAFRLLEQSVSYCKKNGYKDLLARSLLIKAKTHLDLSMMDASFRDLVEARPLFDELGDNKGVREILNVHGCIYLNENNPVSAISYFKQAYEIDQKNKYTEWLMGDIINMSLAYSSIGEIDTAASLYKEALSLVDTKIYPLMSITVYMNIAWSCIEKKEGDKAVELISKALNEPYLAQNQRLNAQVLLTAAYAYLENKDEKEGIRYLEKSFEIAEKYGFVEVAYRVSTRMSGYYMEKKSYEQASKWLILKSVYSDSSSLRQNIINLTDLRYQYKYQQQEQELAYKQKMRLFGWIFIILVLMLAIVLLLITFSRYRLKLKNSELMRVNMANELEHKKKEVFTKVMYLRKKNEAIAEIAERLIEKKPVFKPENQTVINGIVKDLLDYCKDDSWKEFELRFEEIYVDFFKNLSEQFPDLTPNEKRLCAYLKLNMTTKDIASLLHLSVAGVESARYRLRKKLRINNTEVDLNVFLEDL